MVTTATTKKEKNLGVTTKNRFPYYLPPTSIFDKTHSCTNVSHQEKCESCVRYPNKRRKSLETIFISESSEKQPPMPATRRRNVNNKQTRKHEDFDYSFKNKDKTRFIRSSVSCMMLGSRVFRLPRGL